MITLKPGRQLTLPVLDQCPSRRPPLHQCRVHTDNLPHRPFTWIGIRPVGEPYTKPVAEMPLQGGVVGFRGSHGGFEQHPAIDGQPPAIQGLDLVRHRHMGVQIRVAGAAVYA
jgi:hypothetical protein